MALDSNIVGGVTGNKVEVDASNRLLVKLPDSTTPANVGAVRFLSENDTGSKTGTAYLAAPETAKKRVKKIEQLQEAIAPIVEAIPEQRDPLKGLIDTLAEYDGTADEYTALMVLVQEQMERIEYEQARKQRNRRIAMAMLMAS